MGGGDMVWVWHGIEQGGDEHTVDDQNLFEGRECSVLS
jgi:hypothetical protein